MVSEHRPHTWKLTGWIAASLFVMVLVILGIEGTGEAGLRMVIRATARTSVLLFAVVFAASSLVQSIPNRITRWLLAKRRYLGVSVAISHSLHLAAIVAVALQFGTINFDWGTVVLGGSAFILLWSMALTSSDAAVAWMGRARWKWLHWIGMYYVWIAFFRAYLGRAPTSGGYTLLTALLVAVLAIRLAVSTRLWIRRRLPAEKRELAETT